MPTARWSDVCPEPERKKVTEKNKPLVDDTVNVEGFIYKFVDNTVGVHTDLPYGIFADFWHHPAEAGSLQQDIHLLGDVLYLYHTSGIAFGVAGDVLVKEVQVLASRF